MNKKKLLHFLRNSIPSPSHFLDIIAFLTEFIFDEVIKRRKNKLRKVPHYKLLHYHYSIVIGIRVCPPYSPIFHFSRFFLLTNFLNKLALKMKCVWLINVNILTANTLNSQTDDASTHGGTWNCGVFLYNTNHKTQLHLFLRIFFVNRNYREN